MAVFESFKMVSCWGFYRFFTGITNHCWILDLIFNRCNSVFFLLFNEKIENHLFTGTVYGNDLYSLLTSLKLLDLLPPASALPSIKIIYTESFHPEVAQVCAGRRFSRGGDEERRPAHTWKSLGSRLSPAFYTGLRERFTGTIYGNGPIYAPVEVQFLVC